MPRIEPLSPPYAPDLRQSFTQIMPPGAEPLVLFRTVAVSERAWRKLQGGSLLDRGPLSLRHREIVIDRTCALTDCAYEWGVHIALLAERAGLATSEIGALRSGDANSSCWSPADAALIDTADALHARATLDDAEWARLRAHFTEEQALEVLLLCGFYRTVAYLANGLDLPLETFGAPLQSSPSNAAPATRSSVPGDPGSEY